MATYLDIALIITSIALIASVVLQNKGVGLGGLTGADSGSVFTPRRGIEKVLFYVTIAFEFCLFPSDHPGCDLWADGVDGLHTTFENRSATVSTVRLF